MNIVKLFSFSLACVFTVLGFCPVVAPYMALDVVIAAEPSSVRVTFPSTR